ncbi:hypothetical protein [Bacteroides ovatus]|uniref:hypothetical protein n=1 Tax=Bacteroides ovatus TaxID=28116 RepID=UPI001F3D6AB8|nr:hypothetical protein [Bacteroides ovatus]MCE8924933.1 hypothetical protein [Bacteroides ovatus]
MKRKPVICNLIIAILLPLLVMLASAVIFGIVCKCGEIHTNDIQNILTLCSSGIFITYIIVMWYVGRSFSFDQIFAIILLGIVGFVYANGNGLLDMGTAIIAIFAEVVIMQIVTFSTLDISAKSE